jgi:copper(I)-binding protein
MKMDGGMMTMRAVDKLPLPAGKTVELKAGGYHVMLMDLAKPLKEGDSVPLKLTFEDKGGKKVTQDVIAPVRALTAGGAAPVKH